MSPIALCLPKATVKRLGEAQDFPRATPQRVYKFPPAKTVGESLPKQLTLPPAHYPMHDNLIVHDETSMGVDGFGV